MPGRLAVDFGTSNTVIAVWDETRREGAPLLEVRSVSLSFDGVRALDDITFDVKRGEVCALEVCDVDLDNGILHIAFNYVVVDGRRVRKDTKTHQDRYLAIR